MTPRQIALDRIKQAKLQLGAIDSVEREGKRLTPAQLADRKLAWAEFARGKRDLARIDGAA